MADISSTASASSAAQVSAAYAVDTTKKAQDIQQLEGADAAALIEAAALPPRGAGQTGSVVNVVA